MIRSSALRLSIFEHSKIPLSGGGMTIDSTLISQYIISGIVIGLIYSLMAMGITFIYGIMRIINWSMGEFYMIGGYLQYIIITQFLGVNQWYIGVVLSMVGVFLLGMVVQWLLIKPMFEGTEEKRTEYATIVTIALSVLFTNLAVIGAGPFIYSPPGYYHNTRILTLPVSGTRFIAFIGTIVLLLLFYLFLKKTWWGRAFQGAAQNRMGIQTAGIDVFRLDQIAFGIGVALAAAAGALLAPEFYLYPKCGSVATMKGFEIIVIAGLGSVPGVLLAGLLLGLIESLGSVFLDPSFRDVYGFLFLLAILAIRPTGLFEEKERIA
jgi:branched-chain amino acid transport system permease protein